MDTSQVQSQSFSCDEHAAEVHSFQAETGRLLRILGSSVYINPEVFLRELISNSSDACDKRKFQIMREGCDHSDIEKLKIEIIPDKERKTLMVRDNGIGMKRNGLIEYLGTIASSGTSKYISENPSCEDASTLIGQFGVGFYSSFLVADKVVVISKHAEDSQHRWESRGDSFTVAVDDSDILSGDVGTVIILHIREDSEKFLESRTLKDVAIKHSGFVGYPLQLYVQKEREVEVDADEEAKPEESEEQQGQVVEVKEKPANKKKVKEVYCEFDHINKVKSVWVRRPETVAQEEYDELYKVLSRDWEGPLATKHFSVEGVVAYTSVLFCPKRARMEMFEKKDRKNCPVKMYVRGVYITDETDLLPEYLNFVCGLVDSPDLPLNVSRQNFQESRVLKVIRKSIVSKILDMMESLLHTDKYKDFFNAFNKHIKLGVHEDSTNRERLSKLLKYHTSVTGPDNMEFLEDYVKRMKPEQKCIYYVSGESYAAVDKSSYVECAKSLGIEIVYMVDAIDEYVINQLKTFQGKELVSLSKEGVELPVCETVKKEREEQSQKIKPFCEYVQSVLGAKVEKVVPSYRMVQSPFCIVTSQYGWSGNMERIMKAQALRDCSQMGYMVGKKQLEVNPNHAVINELNKRYEADANSTVLRDVIQLLFSTCLMVGGFCLEDPGSYASRIYRMVELGLGLEGNTVIPDCTEAICASQKEKDTDEEFMKSSDDEAERMEEVD